MLFFALRLCLGPLVYTYDVHRAWVKVYSRMLKIVVPIAISYEIQSGSKMQIERFGVHSSTADSNQLLGVKSKTLSSGADNEDDNYVNLTSEQMRTMAPLSKKN